MAALPKTATLGSPEHEMVTLCGERGRTGVIKGRMVQWGSDPALYRWTNCNHHGGPSREKWEAGKEVKGEVKTKAEMEVTQCSLADARLRALKLEQQATNQRAKAAAGRHTRQRKGFYQELP